MNPFKMHSKAEWNHHSPNSNQRPTSLQQQTTTTTPTNAVATSAAVDGSTWCVCRVHTADRARSGRGVGGIGGFLRSRFPSTGDWYEHDDGQMTSSNCLFGTLTYRQSSFVVCLLSTVFAASIVGHEIAIEGGFDVRNYVAVAFCVVWFIVNILLFIGTYLRAPFMLMPWMALMVALTPIFFVAILVGSSVIHSCVRHNEPEACLHEYHMFGTFDHVISCVKLVLVGVILAVNTLSGYVVYQFYRLLSNAVMIVPLSPMTSPAGDWPNPSPLFQSRHLMSNFTVVGSGANAKLLQLRHHRVIRRTDSCDSQIFMPLCDGNSGVDDLDDEINTTNITSSELQQSNYISQRISSA